MLALLCDSVDCSRTDGSSKFILDAKSPAAVNETSSPLCSACWHALHTSPEAMAEALRYITVLCLPDTNTRHSFPRSRLRGESQMMS